MRDIRKDLSERLTELAAERERLTRQFQVINEKEDGIKQLLAQEESRWNGNSTLPFVEPELRFKGTPLQMFLLNKLSNGADWPLKELVVEARSQGIVPQNGSVGRTLHGGLIGLKKIGLVDMPVPGTSVWRLTKKTS